jgi:CubicO group peptidase (beta-lactamase class C family)
MQTRRQLLLPLATLALLAPTATAGEDHSGDDLSVALEALRAEHGAPGLVAMALQDGEVIAWGAAGVRVEGGEARLDIDDPIHLGSCGKAMSATLVARLVQEGVLSFETTIAEALPEFSKEIDAGFHDVTILQLLQHRGGIAERARPELSVLQLLLRGLEGTPSEVRREILAEVMAQPPHPVPASGFDYSNFGYMTTGLMVEELTGKTWEQLIVEQVFEPLEMQSAGVGSPAGDGVPVGHTQNSEAWKPLPPGPAGFLPDAMAPAGLLHSNLRDWGRFCSDHVAGSRGEDGILPARTYAILQTDPGSSGYAAGWGVTKHTWSWGEGRVLTHNGSDNTWMSLVFAMPEWDLIVLTAANCGGTAGERSTTGAKDLLLTELGFKD